MGECVPISLWVSRELNNLVCVTSCSAFAQILFYQRLLFLSHSKENDVLLLSQSFDDTALRRHFQPPNGTELLGFTNSFDEVSVNMHLIIFLFSLIYQRV
jgi:hypothetical protein